MNAPLINILIRRTIGREAMFARCMQSVTEQTYKNWQTRVHVDNPTERTRFDYDYNLFCNDLKAQVMDGWFFFLDDDDYLIGPDALSNIAAELTNPDEAVICQFLRGERAKPQKPYIDNKRVVSGKIGMPCLLLHAKNKEVADIKAEDNGDYLWIKSVTDAVPTKFVEKILVCSPKRSWGK